jgi:hypothetical protein
VVGAFVFLFLLFVALIFALVAVCVVFLAVVCVWMLVDASVFVLGVVCVVFCICWCVGAVLCCRVCWVRDAGKR